MVCRYGAGTVTCLDMGSFIDGAAALAVGSGVRAYALVKRPWAAARDLGPLRWNA